ncbi:MAG TPA: VOC family protein [Hyphomonadaceae bacterium]|nr:VOC family protein [Hyphomonadaceae bacterium]
MKLILAAILATLATTNAADAQMPPSSGPAPATGSITSLPDELQPRRLAAIVIAVDDMPAQQKWYETVFGFKKIGEIPGPREIILSLDPKDPNSVPLVLQAGTARQPGATTYGRFVVHTDRAAEIAAFLQTHGVAVRTISPTRVFYVNDPEGNVVEIYQPPPAAK